MKSCDLKRGGKKYQYGNVCHAHKKLGLFLSVHVDDVKMVEETQNMDSLWKILQKKIDNEDPTPFSDQVYFGLHAKRGKQLIPKRVQSKTELFKKLRTTREADEKDQTKEKHSLEERSLLLAMISKVMPKNALRDSANWQRKKCLLPSRLPHRAQVITKYFRIIMK